MAGITVSGTPTCVAATSVTLPTHAVGDCILIFAFNNAAATLPTVPTAGGTVPAWVTQENSAGANTCAGILCSFIATATNHTSGTWTNATGMATIVLSGVDSTVTPGGTAKAQSTGSGTNTANAPSITMVTTTGDNFVVHFVGHRNLSAWGTTPGGYTLRASEATTGRSAIYTKDVRTTDGTLTLSVTNANSGSGFIGKSIEIVCDEIPAYTPTITSTSSPQ